MAAFLLIVKDPLAFVLDNLNDSSIRVANMQFNFFWYDGSRRKHSPKVILPVSFFQFCFYTTELY